MSASHDDKAGTISTLPDLLAERLGGAALLASDEFFAPKENLLKAGDAVFLEHAYTERGKLMDGWESRRKREKGHDWCILRLGVAGQIRRAVVDTAHFKGNFPESCSIDACHVAGNPTPAELASSRTNWIEILPRSALAGDSKNAFAIDSPWCFSHVRLNIHPDGGVARLRLFGEPMPDWKRIAPGALGATELDLAAVENGGIVLATSDRFFGSPHNLLMPGRGTFMGDGWETRRRRGHGPDAHDWAVIRLGIAGAVGRIEVDTAHFKGNFPESCSIQAAEILDMDAGDLGEDATKSAEWSHLLPRQKLQAHTRHHYESELIPVANVTHVRLNIFPDGGVSRLRVFGAASASGRTRAGLRWLDASTPLEAEHELVAALGSTRWARTLASQRPFMQPAALHARAERISAELAREDWLEAFAAHPRIGEPRVGSDPHAEWARREQSGVAGATRGTLALLSRTNDEYALKFGWKFIVCATGKSAEDMLVLLNARLTNSPDKELRIAIEEQQKIATLRLAKLIGAA